MMQELYQGQLLCSGSATILLLLVVQRRLLLLCFCYSPMLHLDQYFYLLAHPSGSLT